MSELAPVPFLMPEASFALNAVILKACERARFSPNIVAHSGQLDFLAELAAVGIGVAFAPRMVAEDLANRCHVRIMYIRNSPMEWNLGLAWRRNGYLSPAAIAWLALIRESVDAPAPGAEKRKRGARRP